MRQSSCGQRERNKGNFEFLPDSRVTKSRQVELTGYKCYNCRKTSGMAIKQEHKRRD